MWFRQFPSTVTEIVATPLFLPLNLRLISVGLEIPVDLLLTHFVLPALFKSWKPKNFYRQSWKFILYYCAKFLRLRSFFFGDRWLSDEQGLNLILRPAQSRAKDAKTDALQRMLGGQMIDRGEVLTADGKPGGNFIRVVAQDNIYKDQQLRFILGTLLLSK